MVAWRRAAAAYDRDVRIQKRCVRIIPRILTTDPRTGGIRTWGRNRAVKTNRLVMAHSISGRQPNFAGLNRGRHLYSAGRPSRWALAHILASYFFTAIKHMLVMAALCNRQAIIFLPCGLLWSPYGIGADHYIFMLWFLSIFFFFFVLA